MADFVVSARKYRPVRFADVVGQASVTTTLRNAIRSGQLAHSFLFCGPRGVGKTTCARILAQAINCEQPVDGVEPCGTCGPCVSFRENSSFNVHEIDAASNNSVDDMRSLTDQVRFPPQSGRYKVYIIDEVHMLSASAFNAFLKTLEEPPPYAIFILATTEKHKILPTILSRCQIFDFNRIAVADMATHLKGIAEAEGVAHDDEGLRVIAQKADGGLRDALSMFDRILAFSGGKLALADVLENLNILDYDVFFRLTEDLLAEDLAAVMTAFQGVLERGFEGDVFLTGLAEHLRHLLVARDPALHALLDADGELRARYLEQARTCPASFLVSGLSILNQADIHYRASRNKRLHVEMTLVKLVYLQRQFEADPLAGPSAEGRTPAAARPAPAAEKKKPAPEPLTPRPPAEGERPAEDENSPVAVPPRAQAPEPATPASPEPEAALPKPADDAPDPAPEPAAPAAAPRTTPEAALPKPADDAPEPAPEPAAPTQPEPASADRSGPPAPPPGTGIRIPSLDDLARTLEEEKRAELAERERAEREAAAATGTAAPIDLDALRGLWKAHAEALVADRQMAIAKLMEAAALEAGGPGELRVLVDNGIQQDMLRDNAVPGFRERVVAAGLALSEVAYGLRSPDEGETDAIPYTTQDRLARMLAKNPAIRDLSERLGLEPEY